jgi:hypothetical protein
VKVNSWPPRAWKSLATRADHRYFCATPSSIIAIHLRIRSPPCCPQHPSSTALTCLTSHRPTVRCPIALSSYPPTPTHDSSAPGRGLMPGGARQLSAVRAPAQVPSPRGRPGWPSAPRRCDPGEVGPPSGGRRRGDVRTPDRLVIALSAPGPAVGRPSSPSSGRPTSGVRCPGVRCPGVRTDRPALSAAMPPRGPRRAGPGVAGCRGPPAGRSGSRCPRCGRQAGGRLPASGLTRRRWCGGWPCPAAMRPTVARGRRLAGVPAAAPPDRRADTGWSRARVPAGWGSPGRSRCSPVPPQGVWAVAGVVPDHGAWTQQR